MGLSIGSRSCPHTHDEKVAITERKHRHIVDLGLGLMHISDYGHRSDLTTRELQKVWMTRIEKGKDTVIKEGKESNQP